MFYIYIFISNAALSSVGSVRMFTNIISLLKYKFFLPLSEEQKKNLAIAEM